MKRIGLLIVCLSVVLFTACMPQQRTDTGVVIPLKADEAVYTVQLQVENELESHTEQLGSISGNMYSSEFGYLRGRFWEEGKGILRGTLVSVNPALSEPFAKAGEVVILKTTDLKVMSILPGDRVQFLCVADWEPVCSLNESSSSKTGECKDTWEFDYCRVEKIISSKE